jgi:hypothetical protein
MTKICPVCNSDNTRPDYDFPESVRDCDKCGSEWNIDDEIILDARDFFTDEENEALGRNKK